jgi:hypothetical protein
MVFWLDYTSPKQRLTQIGEFQSLLSKALAGDVIKITMNASLNTLDGKHRPEPPDPDAIAAVRLDKLTEQLGDYVVEANSGDMSPPGLAKLLTFALKRAAADVAKARRAEKIIFQPLTAFRYIDDHHQMVTLTGVLTPRNGVRSFLKNAKITGWSLATTQWGRCREIAVPALTTRERLAIDALLPGSAPRSVLSSLRQSLGLHPVKARQQLRSYADYSTYYPTYLKAII